MSATATRAKDSIHSGAALRLFLGLCTLLPSPPLCWVADEGHTIDQFADFIFRPHRRYSKDNHTREPTCPSFACEASLT